MANTLSGSTASTATSAAKVIMIVATPVINGMSAATIDRNTQMLTRNSSGNANASARPRSAFTCALIAPSTAGAPPTRTPASSPRRSTSRSATTGPSASGSVEASTAT